MNSEKRNNQNPLNLSHSTDMLGLVYDILTGYFMCHLI